MTGSSGGDPSFWATFWPTVIATLIGVAVGIPVGLYLDRRRQKSATQSKVASDAARTREVAWLLHESVGTNCESVAGVEVSRSSPVLLHMPDLATWEMTKGDVIALFDDPKIRMLLGTFHAEVEGFVRLLDRHYEVTVGPATATATSDTRVSLALAVPKWKERILDDGATLQTKLAPMMRE
jgi:hypothetical protein